MCPPNGRLNLMDRRWCTPRPGQTMPIPHQSSTDTLIVAEIEAERQREFRQLICNTTAARDGAGDETTRKQWQITIDELKSLEAPTCRSPGDHGHREQAKP
ncbi:hypothetical protein PG997_005647 [Apiospora hydei]|uniref:Uncharacterized protein n=1 Tax=Apiospora hydei TaxID=1337664 RepID=A0ABR1WLJ7_9PEZI